MTRRRFVQGISLGAAGVALGAATACGESTAGPTAASGGRAVSTAAGQATAQPVRGGTLRIASPADIAGPSLPFNNSQANQYLQMSIYDHLMFYGPDSLEPIPRLAESWKFSPDYGSLTLNLRKGVTWHSGRPFTSEDVKWNLQNATDPAVNSNMINFAKMIQKIDTPDASSVVLQFDQPRPTIIDLFPNAAMADPQTWAESRATGKRWVGTGPFVFKEWVPGDHWTVTRNPDYWRAGLPYLDEITARIIPEAQTRLINLQTDTADVATDLEPLDLKQLVGDKKFNVVLNAATANVWSVGCDVLVPTLADKRVRQAIASLQDRKRIVDSHLAFSEPMNLPWPKQSPGYQPDLADRNPYDPAKARQLLAAVGNSVENSFTINVSEFLPLTRPMAEMLQAEMTKLNWKADIRILTSAEWNPTMTTRNFRGVYFHGVGFQHLTPSTLFIMAAAYRVPNASNFDSPAYSQLIADMLKTGDSAQLKALYGKMNELLLDECFYSSIAANNTPVALSAKVFFPKSRTWVPTSEVWKAK